MASKLSQLFGRRPEGEQPSAPAPDDLFTIAFETALIGIVLLDNQERITRANPVCERMLGYEPGELVGTAFNYLSHLNDIGEDRAQLIELLEGRGSRYELEKRLIGKEGDTLWVRLAATAVKDPATGGRAALVMIEDRTHRREIEGELRSGRKAIQNLYEVVAAEHVDFADKMKSLLELGCKQFNLETGVLGRVNGNSFEVKQVVSPDRSIRRGDTYEIAAAQTEEAIEVGGDARPAVAPGLPQSGLPDDWRSLPSYCETEGEAYLGAPIMVDGQMYGTLNFSSPSPRRAPFEEGEMQLLKLMAQWVGSEISRRQARADLEAKQAELQEANVKLEALATHDGLTGVKNRRAFGDQLDVEFRRAIRYSTSLSLILLDVDKFKTYNDTFGHPAGDEVLITVAKTLQSGVRNIDFVARYGGEEFVILLPNTDAEGAMILADRLRQKIAGHPWKLREVTASFGIASMTPEITDPAKLTFSADLALYHSKEAGRNRVTHFDDMDPIEAAPAQATPAQVAL